MWFKSYEHFHLLVMDGQTQGSCNIDLLELQLKHMYRSSLHIYLFFVIHSMESTTAHGVIGVRVVLKAVF